MNIEISQEVTYFEEVGRDGQLGHYVKINHEQLPPRTFGPFLSAKAAKEFIDQTQQAHNN